MKKHGEPHWRIIGRKKEEPMDMTFAQRVEALSAHPLFQGVSQAQCLRLAMGCPCLSYGCKQIIAHPQDDRRAAFIVISGSVLVSANSGSDSETTGLLVASQGMLFGAEALAGRAFPLMARSVAGPAVVLKIPADKASNLLKDDTAYLRNLSAVLADQSARILDSLQSLRRSNVASRIARLLMGSRQGAKIGMGTGSAMDPSLTHAEIALLVFSTRETVTLILSQFKREGLVSISGRTLVVEDPARLANEAEKGG